MSVNIPWWAKIGSKIILSRLPFNYRLWQKMGLFRHGRMDQSGYLSGVFDSHISRAGINADLAGKTVLELGPGDSVGTALLAASYGAKAYLIDAGDFAVKDVGFYQTLADDLKTRGLNTPDISHTSNLNEILEACRACYLTNGVRSFTSIETGTIDIIFSQAVLEHVRKHEFLETMSECRRVLSDNGVASHRVDLKDHLGGGLNNLRFRDNLWESDFFTKSGFYTNRIRYTEMLSLFKEAGFCVDVVDVRKWGELPIKRSSLDAGFSEFSNDELMVKGFDVLLRPNGC